jgi:hypothetical protein
MWISTFEMLKCPNSRLLFMEDSCVVHNEYTIYQMSNFSLDIRPPEMRPIYGVETMGNKHPLTESDIPEEARPHWDSALIGVLMFPFEFFQIDNPQIPSWALYNMIMRVTSNKQHDHSSNSSRLVALFVRCGSSDIIDAHVSLFLNYPGKTECPAGFYRHSSANR